MPAVERGVGYCLESDCTDRGKGVFLYKNLESFFCSLCRRPGSIVRERASYTSSYTQFKQARVEYRYNPHTDKYTAVAIVRDESLLEGDSYTLYSPLIRTDKRALMVAELLLSNLSIREALDNNPWITNQNVKTISFDRDISQVRQELQALALRLENSNLAQRR